MITYGAITPRTSGDLCSPESLSHPSSSSASLLADEGKKMQKYQANLKRPPLARMSKKVVTKTSKAQSHHIQY